MVAYPSNTVKSAKRIVDEIWDQLPAMLEGRNICYWRDAWWISGTERCDYYRPLSSDSIRYAVDRLVKNVMETRAIVSLLKSEFRIDDSVEIVRLEPHPEIRYREQMAVDGAKK